MRLRTLVGASCALAMTMATVFGTGVGTGEARQEIDPADFSSTITNRYFPLSELGPKVFEGTDTDPDTGEVIETRLESRVLPDTIVVDGVTVTVLEETAFEDGELVELALDYFAQHRNGDVYYFGEAVDNYEAGALKDHHGQWLSGVDGAVAGVYIGAAPAVGITYEQELAPGVAEDKSEVLAVGETVSSPAGTYTDCVKTRDYTPLEPGIEEAKWHCAGVGLVREEGDGSVNELVSVEATPDSTEAPTSPAGIASPGASAETPSAVPSTGSGPGNSDGMQWVWMAVAAGLVLMVGGGVLIRMRSR